MPILAIKVPSYLTEKIPSEVFTKVTEMGGYVEPSLHICLAIIDYNPKDIALYDNLVKRIQSVFDSFAFQEPIYLDAFNKFKFSEFNYGMIVKQDSNEKLKEIFNRINVFVRPSKFPCNLIKLKLYKLRQQFLIIAFTFTQANLM